MTEKDNGVLAFPSGEKYLLLDPKRECSKGPLHAGMTLRDYLSAKALFWVINEYNTKRENEAFEFANAIARDCYLLADAMLEARDK